ncbi:hypothetical protein AAZX31_05G216400 [Glycine max]|uniref:Uncharacterized protein n=2 Tax=Glycine subgen. Soja TaxID=1462606 RepID=I1K5U5_SOYBN|nr:uncharacterized protein LOC113001643 [Glycine max]KHN41629.1 hypothetical protein glysoja_036373 [Glycine soja]KAG5041679.1 hypothetical protein JHK85_014155 [Glycine max]KAG5058796.1 hypothetical protein JHK86_013792 [Glycine max]KAG5155811.1 hypothetical protein JHK82_013780 [Glycine max]KAH1135923.1 hypothetical protein GYH30_013561 [Glycine max]|eukprot:XP_025984314.1 uncharacterized protein LOC113001643 [Glycine max]
MASQSQVQISKLRVSVLPESDSGTTSSPKGQCLCSPTTHEGSFRCRFHRSVAASSSPPSWMKRSDNN